MRLLFLFAEYGRPFRSAIFAAAAGFTLLATMFRAADLRCNAGDVKVLPHELLPLHGVTYVG